MRLVLLILGLVLYASTAMAQTPIAGSERLEWNHDGLLVARFEAQVDALPPVVLVITQTGNLYRASLPAMTPGTHTISVRACNVANCSAPATVQVLLIVTAPAAVTNLRVVAVVAGGG